MFSIYVSSYDGAFDLWKPFFDIFYSYWDDCAYPVFLINNKLSFDYSSFHNSERKPFVINTGEEINWFHRSIDSLKKIESDYVLFMLEDYYLSKKQDNRNYEKIIEFMKKNNAWYYQLSIKRGVNGGYIVPVRNSINYPISLQPAIWNRLKLITIMEKINGNSPWDFEQYFKVKYKNGDGEEIKGAYYDTRDILGYKNGVLRGNWIPSTVMFYRGKGINISLGNRPMLSKWKEFKFNCAVNVSHKLNEREKEIIKRVLFKLGISYLG